MNSATVEQTLAEFENRIAAAKQEIRMLPLYYTHDLRFAMQFAFEFLYSWRRFCSEKVFTLGCSGLKLLFISTVTNER